MVLICISLMVNAVELLLMYLLAICMVVFFKYLFNYLLMFNSGCFFAIELYKFLIYFFNVNFLSDIWFANIFFHSVGYLFYFVDYFLCCAVDFHFDIVPLNLF